MASTTQSAEESAQPAKALGESMNQASGEQAQGIRQMAGSVPELEQSNRQTAAQAEECASASEELNAQAGSKMAMVGRLRELVGAGG